MFSKAHISVRAQRNYEGEHWVTYDRQFRREALARQDLNWSVPDSRLYQEAFTGRARSLARCSYCLADDHTSAPTRTGCSSSNGSLSYGNASLLQGLRAHPQKFAAASMRVGARLAGASTGMLVVPARDPKHGGNAPEAKDVQRSGVGAQYKTTSRSTSTPVSQPGSAEL